MNKSIEQHRSGFEAWVMNRVPGHKLKRRENGDYVRYVTQCAWVAWAEAKREASTEPSAIRDAALEEAALVADANSLGPADNEGDAGYTGACEDIASAIRDLKSAAGALTDDAEDALILKLSSKQAKDLQEALYEVQDEGPAGEGWASDKVAALRIFVDAAIEAKAGSGT
jgi:hypothetical protein